VAVLIVFADGVGLGADDPATNPVVRFGLPRTAELAGVRCLSLADAGGRLTALDASLGVDGLPQSATGQATLLTGVNAAAHLGRHWGPYAGAALRPLLSRGTWWHDVGAAGGRATLANAYPERYLQRARSGTGRMGAFARSATLAGLTLRDAADLTAGAAVSAFITNEGWRDILAYPDVPDATPEQAGENLGRLAATHDLTVFDFYATDIAGHRQDWQAAEKWLDALDLLAATAFAALAAGDTLLLVSDHGNLEDLSTGHHTRNPALGLWLGAVPWSDASHRAGGSGPAHRLAAPHSLTEIAPALRALLGFSSRYSGAGSA
jgi:hypothetical protein